jgi:hypothetical protein
MRTPAGEPQAFGRAVTSPDSFHRSDTLGLAGGAAADTASFPYPMFFPTACSVPEEKSARLEGTAAGGLWDRMRSQLCTCYTRTQYLFLALCFHAVGIDRTYYYKADVYFRSACLLDGTKGAPWVQNDRGITSPKGRKRNYARENLVRILIAPLSIPHRENGAEKHDSNRRQQQHEHGPVQRPLTLLGRGPGVCIAHCASLPEGGHRASAKHNQQRKRPNFAVRKGHKTTSRPSVGCDPHPERKRKT